MRGFCICRGKCVPIGLFCYVESKPIAWCSIAPRNLYRDLSGNKTLPNVWSWVCFFKKRKFRENGINEKLINEAVKYAKVNGAKFLEACPVAKDSLSYRFMGFKPTFEKAGFEFNHKAENGEM